MSQHPVKHPVQLGGVHHAAYRCKDAKETVEWYGKMLNMDFMLAIEENRVHSTHETDPYMNVFLNAGQRQVPGAKVALQHNLGLGGAVVVTMYRGS